ncbi:glycosyltransferase [Candidatus Daviesbacteria bacterium]|nr:glycosyltransferase [Candidatus Daviesbacteria bacterium]
MKIFANTIVNNEENFIWFAIMSVVDFVDKVLVWDTGSTDKTVEIIQEIRKLKGDKVDFREVGSVDKYQFTKMRQAMLDESNCDWLLILDGDEIWWEDSIRKVVNEIKENGLRIEGIVVPFVVPIGDIYHFQKESAGQYQLLGRKGHLSLRAINKKIPGLHVDWPYGKESYLDMNNKPIQQRKGMIFLDAQYLHVTHLKRSSSKRFPDKFKFELGSSKKDFKYPEVFYNDTPLFVSSPWIKISGQDLIKSQILTPLRKIKRKFI